MAEEQILIQLSAFLDRELPPHERDTIEAALQHDAGLRRQLEILKKLNAGAAALPVPEVAAWQEVSGRTTARDHKLERRLNAAAARILVPEVSEERMKTAWQNVARRTVKAQELDREAIHASAAFDGEAQSEVSGSQRDAWTKLDQSARTLPVPALAEVAWDECFQGVTQRTVSTAKLAAKVSALAVPQLSEAAAARAWTHIAARTVGRETDTVRLAEAAGVPQVTDKKWDGVWRGIESRIAKPVAETQPVEPGMEAKVVRAEAQFKEVRTQPPHPWRWISGAVIAAGLLAAVLVSRMTPAPVETGPAAARVAMAVPEPLDDRYMVSVRYVQSQPEPVVCFFLKKDAEEEEDDGAFWFSNIK